jgi:hypothetical protein
VASAAGRAREQSRQTMKTVVLRHTAPSLDCGLSYHGATAGTPCRCDYFLTDRYTVPVCMLKARAPSAPRMRRLGPARSTPSAGAPSAQITGSLCQRRLE